MDKLNNTNLCKSKGELPIDVRKAILPIYNDLSKEGMLKKCLQGKTQNANESFNGTIWNRIPKATRDGLSTLYSGVYGAASHFNYGQKTALDTIRLLDTDPGIHLTKCCGSINNKRKHQSIYKTLLLQKKRLKSSDILQKSVMTKLLNKKEPLMKQGVFETFALCLNCCIYIDGTTSF